MRLPIHFGCGSIPTRSPHFGASLVAPLTGSFGVWDSQAAASHNKVKKNLSSKCGFAA
jgi:hypothetical protein